MSDDIGEFIKQKNEAYDSATQRRAEQERIRREEEEKELAQMEIDNEKEAKPVVLETIVSDFILQRYDGNPGTFIVIRCCPYSGSWIQLTESKKTIPYKKRNGWRSDKVANDIQRWVSDKFEDWFDVNKVADDEVCMTRKAHYTNNHPQNEHL